MRKHTAVGDRSVEDGAGRRGHVPLKLGVDTVGGDDNVGFGRGAGSERNPRGLRLVDKPGTAMPNLGLSDDDATKIAAYLETLK